MSVQMTLAAALATVLSFVTFVVFFDAKLKQHSCGDGCTYTLAWLYLALVVVGMVGLAAPGRIAAALEGVSPESRKYSGSSNSSIAAATASSSSSSSNGHGIRGTLSLQQQPAGLTVSQAEVANAEWVKGMSVGAMAGVFAAMQYAAVTVGKRLEQQKHGCFGSPDLCPPLTKEAFSSSGSWMVTFGFGAMLFAVVAYVYVSFRAGRLLELQLRVRRCPCLFACLLACLPAPPARLLACQYMHACAMLLWEVELCLASAFDTRYHYQPSAPDACSVSILLALSFPLASNCAPTRAIIIFRLRTSLAFQRC